MAFFVVLTDNISKLWRVVKKSRNCMIISVDLNPLLSLWGTHFCLIFVEQCNLFILFFTLFIKNVWNLGRNNFQLFFFSFCLSVWIPVFTTRTKSWKMFVWCMNSNFGASGLDFGLSIALGVPAWQPLIVLGSNYYSVSESRAK